MGSRPSGRGRLFGHGSWVRALSGLGWSWGLAAVRSLEWFQVSPKAPRRDTPRMSGGGTDLDVVGVPAGRLVVEREVADPPVPPPVWLTGDAVAFFACIGEFRAVLPAHGRRDLLCLQRTPCAVVLVPPDYSRSVVALW
jgi:hypothetical protein